MDISTLTPRQFVAGLMRGNRSEFRQGYSAESAALTVAERHGIEGDERAQLIAYAQGFADGLIEDGTQTNPAARESEAAF